MKAAQLGSAAALAFALLGCASVPKDPAARAAFEANHDPLEPMNRKIFAFNQGLDRRVIKPLAKGYLKVVPRPVRDALHNFIANLNEPVVFINDLLQANLKKTGVTAGRFVLNSTVGIGGILDVATRNGLPEQSGDFGQTLFVWGVPEGPYLVLPVLGPSTPREATGDGVDIFINPWRYVYPTRNYPTAVSVVEGVVAGVDERARNLDTLDELQRESVDFYAAMRSLYRQNRASVLRNGQPAPPPSENFYEEGEGAGGP